MWWAAILVISTGCGRILGIGDFHLADAPGTGGDGGIDAPLNDGALCIGNGFLGSVCLNATPPMSVVLANPINTDDAGACTQLLLQNTVADICVIAASTIDVEGSVVVTGTRPLALIALDTITISGTLDASSRAGVRVGPGANAASCPSNAGLDNSQNGGSGGAGGAMGTAGGGGGSAATVPGPPPDNAFLPTKLRGGCPGGKGGSGSVTGNGGDGGAGGGALYLLAGSSVSIGGAVFASGAGGAGSLPSRAAGGGGGAGGFIGLEAPTITVAGTIAANGGGGGGGGDAQSGSAGQDGTTTSFNVAAAGGTAESVGKGAPGGAGAALQTAAQNGGSITQCCGGAGGGGGGLGIVWVKGAFSGMKVSPPPMLH